MIDFKSGGVHKDGKTIDLTKNEFFILSVLVKSNNEIISRHELMKMLWMMTSLSMTIRLQPISQDYVKSCLSFSYQTGL